MISGSTKKLFSVDCVNLYFFSIFFSIDFAPVEKRCLIIKSSESSPHNRALVGDLLGYTLSGAVLHVLGKTRKI